MRFAGAFERPAPSARLVDPDEVAAAERTLGHPLPPILQEFYEAFDGFEGPTTTSFLYPLVLLGHFRVDARREGSFAPGRRHISRNSWVGR